MSRTLHLQRALDGLSLGDAFGERFFGPPEVVASRLAHRELPAGLWTWTDDTAMALSLVEVLQAHGTVDQQALALAFARRFKAEPRRGYGAGAWTILSAIASGTDWREASMAAFPGGSMGNGGAMRVAPLGAWFADDLPLVATQAKLQAEVTHGHPDGQAGAIAVALATAVSTRGADRSTLWKEVLRLTPESDTKVGLERASQLPVDATIEQAVHELGSGTRVLSSDTVPFSLWCAARALDGSFTEAMWATVSGLGDRDTTCAIVGGILGARLELPVSWLTRREPLPR